MKYFPINARFWIFLLIAFCFVLEANSQEFKVVKRPVNFGFREASLRNISAVIVHSTFNNSGGEKYDVELIIKQFARYKVSAHYLIGRDGTVYSLVNENNVAFHAGKSELPNGKTYLNGISIGIELITSFEEAPTDNQIQSLTLLVNDIKKKHPIEYVLRHSDVAAGRKTDPWNMDWDEFLKGIN